MRVGRLWRYPVKSMGGERLDEVDVEDRGVVGDRLWALRLPDGKLGSGKSSRRFRRVEGLLDCHAFVDAAVPTVELRDGTRLRADAAEMAAAIRAALGVDAVIAPETDVPHHDDAPIHLVTTASLEWLRRLRPDTAVDERRLRPNIVVAADESGVVEDAWVGREIAVGGAVLHVASRTERCVMTTMAQPGLAEDGGVLRAIVGGNDRCLGVYADVVQRGRVAVGDRVTVR